MNRDMIDKILTKHKKYLLGVKGGVRADLRDANLVGADLYGANLECADLRRADLRDADLEGANLRRADLYGADLRRADLRDADLRRADLRRADLTGANLRGTNLVGADLTGANLRDANLYGADILSFQFNRHFAYSHANRLKIGCKDLLISDWIINFEDIGKSERYTETEIKAYGVFIKLCAKVRGVE
jgi:hypothetical protein